MKLASTFLLGIIISIQVALGCDCKEQGNLKEAQKRYFENSDLIFLGKLIELNDNGTFKFEILETFKGRKLKFIELQSTHSCSVFPREDDKYWLVYLDKPSNDEPVNISSCGLSRSFKYPYRINVIDLPPPPPPSSDSFSQLEFEIQWSKLRTKSLEILKEEIEQLRSWRNEK